MRLSLRDLQVRDGDVQARVMAFQGKLRPAPQPPPATCRCPNFARYGDVLEVEEPRYDLIFLPDSPWLELQGVCCGEMSSISYEVHASGGIGM